MILGIDHIGVAVRDAAAAGDTFAALTGARVSALEAVPAQAVRVCFLPEPVPTAWRTSARLEFLEPEGEDGAVGSFLSKRGEGMHHVCFAVDDITAELSRLEREGCTLVDRTPRPGHGGLVAFVHPKSAHGVLIELLQRDPHPTAGQSGAHQV